PTMPLGMGTPTDKALESVVNNLPVLNDGMLDQRQGPVYVVLATDGAPNDNCEGGRGGRGNNAAVEQRVIDITAEGTRNGMQMFVISLAGDDMDLSQHLAQVADATSSRTPPYAPSTQDDLIAAFEAIVGSASCQVALNGQVTLGQECEGKVQLNGVALECNKENGWQLNDDHTVQLNGTACTQFLGTASMVVASFPCDVFTPG
ncbi:MAG: vWA domain-containing protein, partial [Polyangiales bacterium]